jgi:hypothetical protein
MTSRRWSTFVSSSVFVLALATGGSARAQFGFEPFPNFTSVGQFGLGYGSGTAFGSTAPFDFGSFGSAGHTSVGAIGGFPHPTYALSTGQRPQTTAAYKSAYDVVTLVPGWSGSTRRVRSRR